MATMHTTTDRVNFRRTPRFADNRIGALHLAQSVTVTGPQEGDRWLPCRAAIDGALESGYVSKNVLREPLSRPRERLIQTCVEHWLRFERGTRREFESPFSDHVGEYWAAIGMDLDGNDREVPWSAAFISFAVKRAGGYAGFVFAAAHARYCHAAIRARLDGRPHPFWGMRIEEHPPALGDMVCRWRQRPIDYDHAAQTRYYASHCDVVVAIEEDAVFCIGGNVRHSVRHSRYPIDGGGLLTGAGHVYAVLRNER